MKKRILAAMSSVMVIMSGCQNAVPDENKTEDFSTEDMNQRLLSAAAQLPHSSTLYFNEGIEITGLGVTFDGRPTSFDGCWLQDAYMQCLFAGKSETELTDIQRETYNGLFALNNDYFYVQPPTIETAVYVKYRTMLITEGVCKLRDKAIRGEISVDEFFSEYKSIKNEGLSEVIEECDKSAASGGNKQ